MLKIFISDYTHRTDVEQLETLHEKPELVEAPVYTPADFPSMFRPTQRESRYTYYAASVACFAKTEKAFIEFLENCRSHKICIGSIEEDFEWRPGQSNGGAIKVWKAARVSTAARAGADISKANRNAISKRACDAIEPFWKLPNKQHKTADLLRQANKAIGRRGRLHYRTAIKHLGRRPIEQANYQAALKRAQRRKAKAV